MARVLIYPEFFCREFGAQFIRADSLRRLASGKGWIFPPEFRFEQFEILHIEALLNNLTVADPVQAPEGAEAIVRTTALATHEAARIAPQWLLQAARGNAWRQRIRAALAAGELRFADPITFEEIPATPAQAVAADAPVQAAPEHSGPPPLLSREMADAFAGIGGRDAGTWKKYLGEPPKWLLPARVASGSRGGAGALWNPVLLACLLMGKNKDTFDAFSRKFRKRPELENWRGAWRDAISWPGSAAG